MVILAGGLVAVLGVVEMLAWQQHWTAVLRIRPEYTPIRFNTALSLTLAGTGLALAAAGRHRWLHVPGVVCAALGAVTLTQRALGRDLGIDEFFVRDYLSDRAQNPGGLATNTAVCFVLIGAAFLTWRPADARGRGRALPIAATVVAGLVLAAALSYLIDAPQVQGWQGGARMALPTALSLGLICFAMLALRWQTRAAQGDTLSSGWIAAPCGTALFMVILLVWQAVIGVRPHGTVPAVRAALAVLVIAVLAGALLSLSVGLAQRAGNRRVVAESLAAELSGEVARRARDELMLRQQAALLDLIPDAVFTLDGERRVTYWNRGAELCFGWTGEEALGRVGYDLLRTEYPDRSAVEAILRRDGHWEGQLAKYTKTGDRIAVETRLVGGYAEDGSPATILVIDTDITARHAAEQAAAEQAEQLRLTNADLVRATAAKSSFLATMSHEIRTPMNAIVGMTGLLLDTLVDPEHREFATTIRNSGDALLAIINDILDFSKIEAGRLDLERHPFVLADCVESAADLVVPQAAAKNIELVHVMARDCPPAVTGDLTRTRQVLVNLLSNAVKFTAIGEVRLRVERDRDDADMLKFSITDTGIGIPPEGVDRLFKAFSQIDSSTTRTHGGTGLGLAISRRLVEAMGGHLWVDSAPGYGSTFHFTARLPGSAALVPTRHRLGPDALVGRHVLVVDDNETNRDILTYHLHGWGMTFDSTERPATAVEWVREGRRYDLAVLDMAMPEMDGVALAGALRALPGGRAVPLVMLTSLCADEPRVAASIEFAAWLTKPVKPVALFNALAEALAPDVVRHVVPAPRAHPSVPPQRRLRILLAEDNLVNQKVAVRILERMGHRVEVAGNGLEALAAIGREQYDAVLMDVQMPVLDGLDATRRIRAERPAGQQPHIIAMTANAFAEDRRRCLEAGMDDYLSKPVNSTDLAAALARAPRGSAAGEVVDAPVRPA